MEIVFYSIIITQIIALLIIKISLIKAYEINGKGKNDKNNVNEESKINNKPENEKNLLK